MRLIDSHVHLDEKRFDHDRDAVIAQAIGAGIERFIVPSVDAASCHHVQTLAGRHPEIFPAFGLHPWFCHRHNSADIQLLKRLMPHAVALGECGLDGGRRATVSLDQQMAWLQPQLELASEFSKPLILHAVKAIDPLLAAIKPFAMLRGVIHSFYGSPEQAERLIDRGFYLGIGSALTHVRNSRFRALVAKLPLERLLIETDAPDQPPAGHRGERNEPAFLIEILEQLASLRGMEQQGLAAILTANTETLFSL